MNEIQQAFAEGYIEKKSLDWSDPRLIGGLTGGALGAGTGYALSDKEDVLRNTLLGGTLGGGLGVLGGQVYKMYTQPHVPDENSKAEVLKREQAVIAQEQMVKNKPNVAEIMRALKAKVKEEAADDKWLAAQELKEQVAEENWLVNMRAKAVASTHKTWKDNLQSIADEKIADLRRGAIHKALSGMEGLPEQRLMANYEKLAPLLPETIGNREWDLKEELSPWMLQKHRHQFGDIGTTANKMLDEIIGPIGTARNIREDFNIDLNNTFEKYFK